MTHIKGFRCVTCEAEYGFADVQYVCPTCGPVGALDVVYDYERIEPARPADGARSMWYRQLAPLSQEAEVPRMHIGGTPLYDASRIAAALGLRQVWVKDDGRNPTASFKDRASAMVVAHALELGISTVATASTGNAAAALAGVCAATPGVEATIFVPASAPEAKIAQLLVYGARVLLVEGTYDDAFDLCWDVCEEFGWYNRSTGINPFTTEGKKTVSFELAEQLNWQVPDVVVVSVGDGSIIGGVHKGFVDMHAMGWIDRIPRLIGVQAEGSSPLVAAWRNGASAQDMQPVDAHTIADSISSGLPRDRAKALRAVRATGGAFVSVTDDQIVAAIPELARGSGVFAEPAGAASYAGLKQALADDLLSPEESVALLVTGSGLKDIRTAMQSVGQAVRVKPTLEAVQAVMAELE
ncbi:MAG: threonine synthase [Anaerolineae bacterium]|nr:threonine synthase [Anaerolineae bacterium]